MSVQTDLKTNPDAVTRGVIPYLQVEGAAAAVDFYKKAFGAVERSRTPGQDGKLMNAQLEINGGLIMVMDALPEHGFPHQPSHSFTMQLIVPDGQGWFYRAVAAGCKVKTPFQRMFWGDLWGDVVDPFGINWGVDQPEISDPGFEIVEIEGGVAAVEWGRPRFADIPAFQRSARERVNAGLVEGGITKVGPELTFSCPQVGVLVTSAQKVTISNQLK